MGIYHRQPQTLLIGMGGRMQRLVDAWSWADQDDGPELREIEEYLAQCLAWCQEIREAAEKSKGELCER